MHSTIAALEYEVVVDESVTISYGMGRLRVPTFSALGIPRLEGFHATKLDSAHTASYHVTLWVSHRRAPSLLSKLSVYRKVVLGTASSLPTDFGHLRTMALGPYTNLRVARHDQIFVITLAKPPENRINLAFAQEIIRALRDIERELGPDSEGCVITRGVDEKFWCTGLDLDESDENPFANSDGFFPLLATLLDYPFPTVALITGHTFGGACPLALAHDYRIMNSQRGFFSMPPVDLGLHFPGIGYLPRLKLRPQVARKMLLEAHRWTGKEAYEDGIVDEIAEPNDMLEVALTKARQIQGKAKMGVYSLLRNELWGEATEKIRSICYVHGKRVTAPAKAKI